MARSNGATRSTPTTSRNSSVDWHDAGGPRDGGSIVKRHLDGSDPLLRVCHPQAAYSAAKGGLAQLIRELAARLGRYNVRVNTFAPGFSATEMTATMSAPDSDANTRLMNRVPLGRKAGPADALGIMQFLLSDASTFVTGQHIAVDGGYTIA